jgi:hypothetical protein
LSIAMLGLLATAVPFAGSLISGRGAFLRSPAAATLSIALPGWAFDVTACFAPFVIGLSYPVVDIAMNVEADASMGGGAAS